MFNNLISLQQFNQIISTPFWIGSFFVLLFLCASISLLMRSRQTSTLYQVNKFILTVSTKPFLFFFAVYATQFILTVVRLSLPGALGAFDKPLLTFMPFLLSVTGAIAFFWLLFNLLNESEVKLEVWLLKNNRRVLSVLLPMISHSLKAAIFILSVNILIPELSVNGLVKEILEKSAKVTLVLVIAWLLVDFVKSLEKIILGKFAFEKNNNDATHKKINTQVRILKKVFLTIIGVVTIAAILMVFDSVRELGAGILTTAGIVSAVGAFASQQSLGRIFAGVQLAFTQPFEIGDVIIVDNELGEVEEISLSNIVVKLWDLRRLILPSDYFTSRGLQNLTRTSTELLGTVFFYVDYTLPVEAVRNEFLKILQTSELWNKKVAHLQVTDIKERTMELRALVSAKDGSTLWNLRCTVREKLMAYIVKNFPNNLCQERTLALKNETSAPDNKKAFKEAEHHQYFKDPVRER